MASLTIERMPSFRFARYTWPMQHAETLAQTVEYSRPILTRYLAGFTEETRAAQAPGLPNHVIWTLGHLSLYMHRAANRMAGCDDKPVPDTDFFTGDGTGGEHTRFDTESICFGSQPTSNKTVYPTLERGHQVFEAGIAHLAQTIREVDDAGMCTPTAWGRGRKPMLVADLVRHMVFHNATHTGQIVDLRRALGLAPII